jgi:hypothetical protein
MEGSTVRFTLACLLFAVLAAAAPAADLAKVDRAIRKEPAYRGKPKYCLLVFGPQARTNVWLVLDGNVLYVDRNGNGDLTEKGECVAGKPDATGVLVFAAGDIRERGGRTKHTGLEVRQEGDGWTVRIRLKGKWEQSAWLDGTGTCRFAARPRAAPVIAFHGPLTLAPADVSPLIHNGKVNTLPAVLGTWGVGDGLFAALENAMVPADLHPTAVIDFPSKRAGGKPIRVRVPMNLRC